MLEFDKQSSRLWSLKNKLTKILQKGDNILDNTPRCWFFEVIPMECCPKREINKRSITCFQVLRGSRSESTLDRKITCELTAGTRMANCSRSNKRTLPNVFPSFTEHVCSTRFIIHTTSEATDSVCSQFSSGIASNER